jgi:hypothetical protein
MKNKLTILFVTSVFALQAQKFSLTPFVGVKAEIATGEGAQNEEYTYFKSFAPRVHAGLSPVLLGFNLEYFISKNIYSIGLVHGDQANSTIRVEYFVKSDSPYLNYQFPQKLSNFAGYNVFKVPFSYKRELFSMNSKAKPDNKVMSMRLHSGFNLQFLRIKGVPVLQNPIGFGSSITLPGDTLDAVSYSGHYNRSFSVSFNLGLDFDFYIKNKRRFNLQLYYEQGTYKIAQSVIAFYKDNPNIAWGGFTSTSRGSSIHFKLGFPINIYSRERSKK